MKKQVKKTKQDIKDDIQLTNIAKAMENCSKQENLNDVTFEIIETDNVVLIKTSDNNLYAIDQEQDLTTGLLFHKLTHLTAQAY